MEKLGRILSILAALLVELLRSRFGSNKPTLTYTVNPWPQPTELQSYDHKEALMRRGDALAASASGFPRHQSGGFTVQEWVASLPSNPTCLENQLEGKAGISGVLVYMSELGEEQGGDTCDTSLTSPERGDLCVTKGQKADRNVERT